MFAISLRPRIVALTLTALSAAMFAWAPASYARVTRIVVDSTGPVTGQSPVPAGYVEITGRAFGELDPNDPHDAIITDISNPLALDSNGKAEYVASFRLRMPSDPSLVSGVIWHDVPNRGGNVAFPADSIAANDVQLLSGWQGDNAGGTAVPAGVDCSPPPAACPPPVFPPPGTFHHYVKTPVLTGVTGQVLARIINRPFGTTAPNNNPYNQPLNVMGNPVPYFPADSNDNSDATLKEHLSETINGIITEGDTIPNSDWKFCYGTGATFASPGLPTSLPVRICLDSTKRAFDPAKLYQLVYTAKDPYVLGAGTAAFRDVQSFFRYEHDDGNGYVNPLYGKIKWAIIRGVSQSGNFTRHFIFLGMNQDEAGRIVHDGAWPIIAGRRVSNNSRWGQPDGVLELYQMGSEGPQWWGPYPDRARDLPPGGILDRCRVTNTCPKIVETFGGSEVFALKMTTEWVGTDPKSDIPLPPNVHRYYLPSSTHGGGNGAMDESPADSGLNCPGNNWGRGTLRPNPVPSTALTNRMRVALRDWLMKGIEPPPSMWPHMHGPNGGTLVEPTMTAMGFPHGIPGIPDSIFAPENFVFPIFNYDWGPDFDEFNATGVPTNLPPPIDGVIKMLVPAVDSDGNELGGVPTVLRDAPLGTYLGWNITAGPDDVAYYDGRPFHEGQVCNYVGGMVPFAKTKAQRLANGDPRPSLEERYGTHQGYVNAVIAAANNAACKGYLFAAAGDEVYGATCTTTLQPGVADDWLDLVSKAQASNVCNQPGDNGQCNPGP